MKILRLAILLALMMPVGLVAQTTPAPILAPAAAAAPTPPPPPPDPANLAKYRALDAQLVPPAAGEKRVILFGDSITEAWARDPNFFPGKSYIGRGISGQTTGQMLIRFDQDVLQLHPAVVVILAGTNDIAQNQGPITLEEIAANLESMAKTARAHGIKPVLCSVLPAVEYPWRMGLHPTEKIPKLNALIKAYCSQHHVVYCDYYSAMVNVNPRLGMRKELTKDGVHPNSAGYALMVPMAEASIQKALKRH